MRVDSEADLETILASDISFSGDIRTEEPLLIKGNFKGSVHSTVDVFISKNAVVEAKIVAKKVSVYGNVKGDVHANTQVELFSTAKLAGNIFTQDLIIESGAYFSGQCTMLGVKD